MFRYRAIAPRRPARSRPELESLEARQVLSSLYPPDPCVAIAPAAVLEKHYPSQPVAPVTSVGVKLYPPSPIGSPSYRSAWSDGPVNDRPQSAYLIDPLPDPSPPPGGNGNMPVINPDPSPPPGGNGNTPVINPDPSPPPGGNGGIPLHPIQYGGPPKSGDGSK
jgi:hypothetical protein